MTRLSLSPEPEEWQQGRYRLNDDSDSSDEDFVAVSYDSCDCEYSDSDDGYPHPLGFPAKPHPSWGRTRFSLDPTVTPDSIEEQWASQVALFPAASPSVHRFMQSYPPVHSYIDPKTASTASLLAYDGHMQRKKTMKQENDKDMEQLTELLNAASLVDTTKALLPLPTVDPNERPLATLADTALDIKKKIEQEKMRMERDNKMAEENLKKLLVYNERKAYKILKDEKSRVAAENEAIQAKIDADNQERQKEEDVRQAKEEQRLAAQKKAEEIRAAKEAEKAKKYEYLVRAKKLVVQLENLRQSIEPFEKSKAVGKRRLNMKKVVRGKVNTLAENAEKIKSVAVEVGQAITVARAEDEELKKQLQAGNTQITPEMPRGKRYLVDLLASSIMVRVQAEGFNGLRGDGFPIANMLALISLENKELGPVLEAHIYTVCPTAIPKLPTPSTDASEEALMKSLGMAKDKKGEYETFSRFLLRTEGIVSLVSNIMAANPPAHKLLGGHKGAVAWLDRFLSILPAAPHSPLPLLTAHVLDAFLTGAGHMLANKHPEEFKAHLQVIENDINQRLDEGAIGQPSATRLKKTVKEGFDGFRTKLPSKALKELYCGADGSDGNISLPAAGSQQQSIGAPAASSPFGAGPSTSAPNPFGGPASSKSSSISRNPFQAASSSNRNAGQGASNVFGGGNSTQAPAFGAGGGSSATPFGQQQGTMGGNNTDSMQDGSNSNQAANPFNSGGSGEFGGGSNSGFAANSNTVMKSGFGGGFGASNASSNPSPFGPPASNSQGSGGFGAGSGGFGANNSTGMNTGLSGGFGASNGPANPSPFGGKSFGASGSSNPSPFGSPSPAASANAFGAPASSNPSLFGSPAPAPSANPFGAASSNSSPFGAPLPAPSGGGFGSSAGSGFGGDFRGGNAGAQSSGFGAVTPFKGGNSQQQTPFGGQQNSFGGNGGQSNSDSRPPCKFFARGQCKFGDKCRFSHSQGGGGGNNNAFGGRRF